MDEMPVSSALVPMTFVPSEQTVNSNCIANTTSTSACSSTTISPSSSPVPTSLQDSSGTSVSFPFLDAQLQVDHSSTMNTQLATIDDTSTMTPINTVDNTNDLVGSILFDPIPLEANLLSKSMMSQILANFSKYVEFNGIFDPQVIRELIRVFRVESSFKDTDESSRFLTCVGIAFGANRQGYLEVADRFFHEALHSCTQLQLTNPTLYSICGLVLLTFYVVQINRFDLVLPTLQTAIECTKQKLRLLIQEPSSPNTSNAYFVYYGLLDTLRQFYLGSQFTPIIQALSFRQFSFFQNDPQIHVNNASLCRLLINQPKHFLHPESYTNQIMEKFEKLVLLQKRTAMCAGMMTIGLTQYYLLSMLVEKYVAPSVDSYLAYLQKVSEKLDSLTKYANKYTELEIQNRSLFMIWVLKLWIGLENNDISTLQTYTGLMRLLLQSMIPVGFMSTFFSLLFVVFEYVNDVNGFIVTWSMLKECIRQKYNASLCYAISSQTKQWVLKESKSVKLKEFLEKEMLQLDPMVMSQVMPPQGSPPPPGFRSTSPPTNSALKPSPFGAPPKLFEIDEGPLYFELDNMR